MHRALKYLILITACAASLAGCGGNQNSNTTAQAKRQTSSQKSAASAYNQVVEQLYVAYFGRPADAIGLANFSAQLQADGAPTDIQTLLQTYDSNNGVKTLIDSFGTSTESKNLYGNTDPTSFVKAVFNNVLGRAPQQAGLDFWVNALTSGQATYGNAALNIMAGALINTTTQGRLDAQLIANRIAVATDFTNDVAAQNANAYYVGSTAAQMERSMLSTVTSGSASSGFQATADAALSSLIASTNNIAAITVDSGADPSNSTSVDVPFVSVTICAPGNPNLCQTIDHVLVDTGSYGLRLIYSTLTPQMAAALSAQSNGNTLNECTNFIDGYTWGPVRQVNLSIAGESASNLNTQIIGDPAFNDIVPSSCAGSGTPENTVDSFGSNGVIGVGLFAQDCGGRCVSNPNDNTYYTCGSTSCADSGASLAQQVVNPVTLFASDNNGVIVKLPSVGLSPPNTLSGSLVFGVSTQGNNALGGASVFQMDENGYFTTVYGGNTMSQSFIDSGSNGLYFPNVTNIAICSDNTSFYCPSSVLSLSAVMQGAPNLVTSVVNTQTVPFFVGSVDSVTGSVSVDFTGLGSDGSFDWGLPFFFGRNVYVVQENMTPAGQKGPFVAF